MAKITVLGLPYKLTQVKLMVIYLCFGWTNETIRWYQNLQLGVGAMLCARWVPNGGWRGPFFADTAILIYPRHGQNHRTWAAVQAHTGQVDGDFSVSAQSRLVTLTVSDVTCAKNSIGGRTKKQKKPKKHLL